jgi:hypothetical protein
MLRRKKTITIQLITVVIHLMNCFIRNDNPQQQEEALETKYCSCHDWS